MDDISKKYITNLGEAGWYADKDITNDKYNYNECTLEWQIFV